MAKRDTPYETLTDLQQALQAVDDSGENPLQSSEGSDFEDAPNISEVLLARASAYDQEPLADYRKFGAIPATDHDTLMAREAADKIVKGEPLIRTVDEIVTTRATTHGRYRDTARISQSLKRVVHMELDDRLARGQPDLTDQQLESIDLICTKLARIFSGDNNEPDHWKDISGYAQIAIEDK